MTLSCGYCDGDLDCEDTYAHDGARIEIHRCATCAREGTLVRYPDGRTAGRGCLAGYADERIHTPVDGLWRLLDRVLDRVRGDA